MELRVFKRVLCNGIPLQDGQGGLDRVEKAHRPGNARLQGNGLGDLADDDMGRYVDLRNFVAAGVHLQEGTPLAVRDHRVQEIPVDLPDLVGDPLDGRSVSNIPLNDLQSGPGVILKPCLGNFTGPQGDGLLTGSPHKRLRNGLLTDDINAGGEVLHQGAPIRPGGDGGAEGASDALNGVNGIFHRRAIGS